MLLLPEKGKTRRDKSWPSKNEVGDKGGKGERRGRLSGRELTEL